MNSSLKKTIQINPELFKIQNSTKSKTKNNREKKSKLEKQITPNFLKKQLIDRIKKYKNNNIELSNEVKQNIYNKKEEEEDDEFILSMNFLSSISNDRDTPTINNAFSGNLEITKIPEITEIKKIPDIPFSPSLQNVNIDLPVELINMKPNNVDNELDINNITVSPIIDQIEETTTKINIVPDNVPYGCLKNGSKPTYRSWLTQ